MNLIKVLLLSAGMCILVNSRAGDCFQISQHLDKVLKMHKNNPRYEGVVFFHAKILGINRHVYPKKGYQALNVKVHEYWSGEPLSLFSDTLCIMANSACSMKLEPNQDYLLVLKLHDGYFTDYQWWGTDLYSHYEKDIALLGQSTTIANRMAPSIEVKTREPIQSKPKRTEKERKKYLFIWLVVSVSLNLFAIMLIMILKKEKA